MKLLYTRENRYLVHNIKNIVENSGIEVMLKNEFSAGGAGDLVPHETWLELWVVNDEDYKQAIQILDRSFNIENVKDWICSQCNEANGGSFEFCWNCQNSPPE